MKLKKKKESAKKIALERISELFNFAEELFSNKKFENIPNDEKHKLANRYVELARLISHRTNTPIPKDYKKLFCKHCHTYFRHGINVRVRLNEGKVVKYCLNCKKFSRFPIHESKKHREKTGEQ
ncbi:MAG: ribonuclease P protein component 4 [Nanoarchaeota archaeon]